MMFRNAEESHAHSRQILNLLYEYDDFMESVGSVIDLGCGSGLDLEWWATATTRDDTPLPLNIRCTGIDLLKPTTVLQKYKNLSYIPGDFEKTDWHPKKTKYDVLWCHDAFQYCINPIETLKNWRNIANENAMLVLSIPTTVGVARRSITYYQPNGCFYHHSIVGLIHMLAVTGWDCHAGFFNQEVASPWIHAVVYKNNQTPLDPKISWYELADKQLLPTSVVESVNRYGFARQEDFVLPWLDKSLNWFGKY